MEIHVDTIDDCIRLARQCELESLIQLIEEKQKKLESFGKWAVTCDFQQCGILTSVDSEAGTYASSTPNDVPSVA